MTDLQELWNSDREQLRQVRELLRKSEARVAELEAIKPLLDAEQLQQAQTRVARAVAELERIDPGGECTGNALAILKGEA